MWQKTKNIRWGGGHRIFHGYCYREHIYIKMNHELILDTNY